MFGQSRPHCKKCSGGRDTIDFLNCRFVVFSISGIGVPFSLLISAIVVSCSFSVSGFFVLFPTLVCGVVRF